ncbi:unnamed protein product [Diatraea saccharalis]|uniref:Protein kinase domain-containing protein n=1 Tax=Diatraea saccharalis TaxID=40085 RepID=A0A9P0C931_9NEOP|nr:unnamed protein product [Diatraea saccharalis]
MGVFKWLRRERVTVTTRHVSPEPSTPEEQCEQSSTHAVQGHNQVGTIRTEEYKRDLAEFQARRSTGSKDLQLTPVKKKCGRHSLPVSCTDCTVDHDNTFNYEKKSGAKYKKKSHRRARTAMSDEKMYDAVPNIQFLFQNQVFMPGNMLATSTYSEPQKCKRQNRHRYFNRPPDSDFLTQRHIDFKEDDHIKSPEFHKKNSLPFDVKNFLDGHNSKEEVDGAKHVCDMNISSQNSSNGNGKNDSGEDKLMEVMSELKNFDRWADEQLLHTRSPTTKSDDTKSDTSAYGLPIASASNIDVTADRSKLWNHGKWGVVPVQIKRLPGVTIDHVRKKRNTEINILRKCRHPNIILLMGLYPDVHDGVNIVCERCTDSLYGILHIQGRILTAQTSVQYALDIANALVFLRMQGYIHSGLSSEGIMVTNRDAAKLADLSTCRRLARSTAHPDKGYELYSPEPQYVNIEDTRQSNTTESEPLLSNRSSEAYLQANAVSIDYEVVRKSPHYRWQAPELFQPDDEGFVQACSKSDVYSLALILWECCNAAVPWKSLSYEKLKELYVLWSTGLRLPTDGSYPGSLLALLQQALQLQRHQRMHVNEMQRTLHTVKCNIDEMEYIVIPARLSKKKSNFSSPWDTTSPTDSECLSSPQELRHRAVVHNEASSADSEKECSKSDASPLYEVINKSSPDAVYAVPEKSFVDDEDTTDQKRPYMKYDHLPEKDFSSACSTPIAKIKARIKDIGTPGGLHRSDSTEYCSILSPNRTNHYALNDNSAKDQNNVERPTAKLSRSFTPKSYKPLHIKVPECNLDSIKSILKEQNGSERSSYNFDIKNYSLPTTPIARSNKLRKNAWLSGDISLTRRSTEVLEDSNTSNKEIGEIISTSLNTPAASTNNSLEKSPGGGSVSYQCLGVQDASPDTVVTQYSFPTRRDEPGQTSSPDTEGAIRERSNSWSFKSSAERNCNKYKVEDEILAGVNVKPLVAIHERWIYEANRKTGRSMSLPEGNNKCFPRRLAAAATSHLNTGGQWEQFCQAREAVARGVNFERNQARRPAHRISEHKGIETEEQMPTSDTRVDQATETRSIEEFIRDLIRKEFTHLLHELSDDACPTVSRSEEILNKGVANIIANLRSDEDKKEVKSFSRVKINGNNKPLLQITFSRSGENSLQVLDGCVSVTVRDGSVVGFSPPCPASGQGSGAVSGAASGQVSDATSGHVSGAAPDPASTDDAHINSLKRCQAFSAIQEARSTEDLYIDDDLSTQMQENFGGKVKLIPLHGSLHEILCEKEDECCLIKVKQENGCDTIYFRCDSSDTESRDALDGRHDPQDTVVYKRSISLVEERIQRIFPKDKRPQTPVTSRTIKPKETMKVRPKSEVFMQQNITKETRLLSNSSPSLSMKDDRNDEVEVNIENVMCYQDSSSEECLKCQADNDDFELLEKKIEEDLANSNLSSIACGCLEKISEENLSIINEEITD